MRHRATHIAPARGEVSVRVLILLVLVLASAVIALGFIVWLGQDAAALSQPWHPPLLTDDQWSIFHKGERP